MIASKTHGTADIYKVMFGDPVASIRQCLKRYCLHTVEYVAPQTTGMATTRVYKPDFPYYRGNYLAGAVNAGGTKNICSMTLINWFTPGFVVRRGGLRWKSLPFCNVAGGYSGNFLTAKREPCVSTYSLVTNNYSMTTADVVNQIAETIPTSWDGAVVQPFLQNSVMEFDLPYYTNSRFWYGKRNDPSDSVNSPFHSVTQGSSFAFTSCRTSYVAASDDFSLSFFTGSPILYIVPTL